MPLNSNIYLVNFKRLIVWLLPAPLRKARHAAFAAGLLAPIVTLYNQFISFRNTCIYRLSITPQVFSLEKLLNDKYDIADRRIYIKNADEKDPLPLYMKSEEKPVDLYTKPEQVPVVLYTKAETAQYGVDFIVVVPTGLVFNETEMSSYLYLYCLPNMKFKIVTQ